MSKSGNQSRRPRVRNCRRHRYSVRVVAPALPRVTARSVATVAPAAIVKIEESRGIVAPSATAILAAPAAIVNARGVGVAPAHIDPAAAIPVHSVLDHARRWRAGWDVPHVPAAQAIRASTAHAPAFLVCAASQARPGPK